jgi:hypothetical protein
VRYDAAARHHEPLGGGGPIQKSTDLCLNCIALTGISRSSSEAALKNYEGYGNTGLPVRADTRYRGGMPPIWLELKRWVPDVLQQS